MSKKTSNKPKLNDVPESFQRYLDEIYTISKKSHAGWVSNKEIAEKMNVEPASVTGMLKRLRDNGYITWEPRKRIRLTEIGKTIAMHLSDIHKTLRQFFEDVLKIDDDEVVENLSCEIEHHISSDVKESLENFISNYLKKQEL